MKAADKDKIDFFAPAAQAYTTRGVSAVTDWMDRFLALVPKGGSILELGCGAGRDSEAMLARGYDREPTDWLYVIDIKA